MLLDGINHIHKNGIIHRDMKPQNCLVDGNFQLKIIDFGLSKMLTQTDTEQGLVGTMAFLAPEVWEGEGSPDSYKQSLDIWSCGVIMYYLLSGEYPFSEPDLEDKVTSYPLEFSSSRWTGVSSQAKELIKRLLEKLPVLRPNADECLNDPFFNTIKQSKNLKRRKTLNPVVFKQLTEYKGISYLKKAALNILVRTMLLEK